MKTHLIAKPQQRGTQHGANHICSDGPVMPSRSDQPSAQIQLAFKHFREFLVTVGCAVQEERVKANIVAVESDTAFEFARWTTTDTNACMKR